MSQYPPPLKRQRLEDGLSDYEEGIEETKENPIEEDQMIERENDEIIEMPRGFGNGNQRVIRNRQESYGKKPAPNRLEYWQDKFPFFPDFVNEAFAAKTRGEECYGEFLRTVEKPGIATKVGKELENGEIVYEEKVVTWF